MSIICMGEMLIDFTPGKEEGVYVANPGGAPANVAISTARNGIETSFLGMMGDDDFGRRLVGVLKNDGVKILHEELTAEAITTLAFVTLYENGERSFTFARKPGADMLLSEQDVKKSDIEKCTMLHGGSVSLSSSPCREAVGYAFRLAKECKKLVSFDVNYRGMIWGDMDKCLAEVSKLLPYIDLMKISDEELYFVGGEDNIPVFMKENNICVLVETLGSKGARYFHNSDGTVSSGIVEGRQVKAVDATGAGDSFWGGFLSRLLLDGVKKTEDISECHVRNAVRYGNIAGSLCVQKMGGIPALPYFSDIEELYNK